MAGIYYADIYCDDCVDAIKRQIASELFDNQGTAEFPDGWFAEGFADVDEVANHLESMNESDYDSDSYPKYFPDNEEADTPQHCGNCLVFLENDLTTFGEGYVIEAVNEGRTSGSPGAVSEEWAAFYDCLEYVGQCSECGDYSDDMEGDLCITCNKLEG